MTKLLILSYIELSSLRRNNRVLTVVVTSPPSDLNAVQITLRSFIIKGELIYLTELSNTVEANYKAFILCVCFGFIIFRCSLREQSAGACDLPNKILCLPL